MYTLLSAEKVGTVRSELGDPGTGTDTDLI